MSRYEWLLQETSKLDPNRSYQVLVGKRSATTLYYAYEHDIKHLFNLLPELDKQQWFALCEQFNSAGPNINDVLPSWVSGALHYRRGLIPKRNHTFRRLSFRLLLQVVSYLKNGRSVYQPVTHHLFPQQVVKQFLRARQRNGEENGELPERIYQELTQIFEAWEDQRLAVIICLTMTGEGVRGLPSEQIMEEWQIPNDIGNWLIEALWDYFQESIKQLPKDAALYQFQKGVNREFPAWSHSVEQTYRHVLKKETLDEIANYRHLKPSTISDHFVELVVNDYHIVADQAKPQLEELSIDIGKAPPQSYRNYQEKYTEAPFWLYRYWQVAHHERGRDE